MTNCERKLNGNGKLFTPLTIEIAKKVARASRTGAAWIGTNTVEGWFKESADGVNNGPLLFRFFQYHNVFVSFSVLAKEHG